MTSVGSEPTRRFTLRLPFSFSSGLDLKQTGTISIGDVQAEVTEGRGDFILLVRHIQSKEEANTLLYKIGAALFWASLQLLGGIRLSTELKPIIRSERPAPADSMMPGAEAIADHGAAIFEDDLEIRFVQMGAPRLVSVPKLERFEQELQAGMELKLGTTVFQDPKFRLAAQLYTESWFEASRFARFLAQIEVLEILKPKEHRSAECVELLRTWQGEVESCSRSGLIEGHDADSLKRSLQYLERQSIRQSIRSLVAGYLGDELGRRAMKLYDYRSDIVHDWKMVDKKLVKNQLELTNIVRELLSAMLKVGVQQPT